LSVRSYQAAQSETRKEAGHRWKPWEASELETVTRADLSIKEAALMLGRTYASVARMKTRLRRHQHVTQRAELTMPANRPLSQAASSQRTRSRHPLRNGRLITAHSLRNDRLPSGKRRQRTRSANGPGGSAGPGASPLSRPASPPWKPNKTASKPTWPPPTPDASASRQRPAGTSYRGRRRDLLGLRRRGAVSTERPPRLIHDQLRLSICSRLPSPQINCLGAIA
jgi:hypothetical protein